jgi:hypothetical protein
MKIKCVLNNDKKLDNRLNCFDGWIEDEDNDLYGMNIEVSGSSEQDCIDKIKERIPSVIESLKELI